VGLCREERGSNGARCTNGTLIVWLEGSITQARANLLRLEIKA